MAKLLCTLLALFMAIVPAETQAAPPSHALNALEGLAPFGMLLDTPSGRAALEANRLVTWQVESNNANQPLLQPFPQQQQQALRDAFITGANADELADGLGSGLGKAYQTLVGYKSDDDGATSTPTGSLHSVEALIAYAYSLSGSDSTAAKYFFANGNDQNGDKACKTPVIEGAAALLARPGAAVDIFGRAYTLPSSALGADPCGDSRPFQTDHRLLMFTGSDFWGLRSGNALYLEGPTQDLRSSPSFPSGHTTYGYTESVLLGILVPGRYAQMVVRGAEYGNDRIIMGAHYAMDVLGGRTLALYDLAHLLKGDPAYVNQTLAHAAPIADFTQAVTDARSELHNALGTACKRSTATCGSDVGRFDDPAKDAAFYESTQTYGLPVVHADTAGTSEDVGALAPEAGYLLTAAFPKLSLKEADDLLTATEGPGGGFLDDGSAFGVYSRIDLYKAITTCTRCNV
jgi:membrane-associated phospholipid phosphatase